MIGSSTGRKFIWSNRRQNIKPITYTKTITFQHIFFPSLPYSYNGQHFTTNYSQIYIKIQTRFGHNISVKLLPVVFKSLVRELNKYT